MTKVSRFEYNGRDIYIDKTLEEFTKLIEEADFLRFYGLPGMTDLVIRCSNIESFNFENMCTEAQSEIYKIEAIKSKGDK